jgi:uncharacterized protein YkwD
MKVKSFLKHTFIPHQDNDYKPHLFREVTLVIIVAISFFLLGVSYSSSFFMNKTVLGASIASSVLIDLTNENRVAEHTSPLVKNTLLEQAATLKGEDMVRLGYFAHNSPEGITPWYWFRKVGYTFLYAGENLAVNFTESADVEEGWLTSPSHRANLLNPKFKEIGIATIEGVYEGNPTVFVVQMFGTPGNLIPQVVASSSSKVVRSAFTKTGVVPFVTTSQNGSSSGEVLGEVLGEVKGVDLEKEIKSVMIQNNFIGGVASQSVEKTLTSTALSTTYSTWYQKLMFNGSSYLNYLYRFLAIFLGFALFCMVVLEIKKQHWKHVSYGLGVIIVVLMCMYGNTFFM